MRIKNARRKKKYVLLLGGIALLCFGLSLQSRAQSVGASCSTSGALSIIPNQLLVCNGSNWVLAEQISNAGYVGIGTNNPSTLFHVNGTATLGVLGTNPGVIVMSGTNHATTLTPTLNGGTWTMTLPTSAGTNLYVLQTDGTGMTSWVPETMGSSIELGISTSATNPERNTTNYNTGMFSATTNTVSFSGLGTEIMRINATGVYLGAANATNAFDVNAGGAFGAYAGIAAPTNGFSVSGNVGIGTSNPSTLLQVNGTEALGVAGSTRGILNFDGATSGIVTVQPATTAGTWTMTLPTSAGSNTYALITNGSGVTSWVPNPPISISLSSLSMNPQRSGQPTTGLYGVSSGGAFATYEVNSEISGTIKMMVAKFSGFGSTFQGVVIGSNSLNITSSTALQLTGSSAFGTYAGTAAPANGIIVSGNVGIGTNNPSTLLHVNGAETLGVSGATRGQLILSGGTNGYITMQPATTAGTWTMTFPTSAGSNGYVLQTDGTGISSWVATPTMTLGASVTVNDPRYSLLATTGLSSPANYQIWVDSVGTTKLQTLKTGASPNGTSVDLNGAVTGYNSLAVNGAASFGTYATASGGTLAPSNGIIISGNVGIGTQSAPDGLDIATAGTTTSGALTISGAWATGTAAAQTLISPTSFANYATGYKGLVINSGSGFSGYLMELAHNGQDVFTVDGSGNINTNGISSTGTGALKLIGTDFYTLYRGLISIGQFTNIGMIFEGVANMAPTSGTSQFMALGANSGETQWNPSSGAQVLNNVSVEGLIVNQTGSATGVIRGLYVSPTITSAYDYRAFEVAPYTFNLLKPMTTIQNVVFNLPTLKAAASTTVTNAATKVITGAPAAGSNVTITNAYALWSQGGLNCFGSLPGYLIAIGTSSSATGFDVNGYTRLAKNTSQPVACSTTNDGAIALTHLYTLCTCKGASAAWLQIVDGATACSW